MAKSNAEASVILLALVSVVVGCAILWGIAGGLLGFGVPIVVGETLKDLKGNDHG